MKKRPVLRKSHSAVEDNAEETLNDIGNKDRFVLACTGRLAYVPEKDLWREWDGSRWRNDDGAAMREAEKIARALYVAAEAMKQDPVGQKLLRQHANRTSSVGKMKAMVELAEASQLAISQAAWDADAMLVGVRNGVIDLATGDLLPPDPKKLISRYANVEYDAAATCPQWRAFVKQIMGNDVEMIRYMKRLAGYSLFGHNHERILVIFYGAGANGKSVFIDVVQAVMGEYAIATPANTFLSQRRTGVPNDIARLAGARLVTSIETDKNQRLSEALIKTVTGQDKMAGRFLYHEFFDFRAVAKIWIATNHKPEVRGTEPGMWDRIHLVPFDVRIPRKQRILGLADNLYAAEAPGILNWMLRGCRDWQEAGLRQPEKVRAATKQYQLDMDLVGRWFEDCCEEAPGQKLKAQAAYDAYCKWCERSHESRLTQRAFGEEIKRLGVNKSPRSSKGFHYLDIVLSTEWLHEQEVRERAKAARA